MQTQRIRSIIVALSLAVFACATTPVDEREQARRDINDQAERTLERLIKVRPDVQKELDASAGYFVGRITGVKAPIVGGGSGQGVLYDKDLSRRTYMHIIRFDVGVGIAIGTYNAVVLIETKEALENFSSGYWTGGVGAETTSLGKQGSAAAARVTSGIKLYVLTENGAALLATARQVRLTVNWDLTEYTGTD